MTNKEFKEAADKMQGLMCKIFVEFFEKVEEESAGEEMRKEKLEMGYGCWVIR